MTGEELEQQSLNMTRTKKEKILAKHTRKLNNYWKSLPLYKGLS
jgi:hypothetical protein